MYDYQVYWVFMGLFFLISPLIMQHLNNLTVYLKKQSNST